MLKPRLLRAVLAVASFLLSLVVLELALSAWYGTLFRPGPFAMAPEWDSPFVFGQRVGGESDLGLRRGTPVERSGSPDVFRILSYGDSISAGFELAEEDTYTYLLERSLDAGAGPPYELLNMARGHSPTVYSFHLRADVPGFDPQGVVMEIELINDVSDEAHVRTSGRDADGLPARIHAHRYVLGWDGHILAPLSFSGSLPERTKLYAKLSRWFGRMVERLRPNPVFQEDSNVTYYSHTSDRFFLTEARLQKGFDRLFESIGGIHRYLERRDIRFLLIILPSRHVYADDRYTAFAKQMVERAEERARSLGIPFVSPDEALGRAGGAALFMDFCHPTDAGNRAIAEAIRPRLEAWGDGQGG